MMVARKLEILITAWSVAAKYPSRAATPEKSVQSLVYRRSAEGCAGAWFDSIEVLWV